MKIIRPSCDSTCKPKGRSTVRVADLTGQSLPVLMASRMMDVLWGDLHMTHQGRSSKSGDSFYRTARTQKILAGSGDPSS